MRLPDYSVLLSVYKKENPVFFKAALDSVFAQTIKPNEVLLVCDGPLTPELEEVISLYREDLNVVRLPSNVGLGEALRQGVIACRNEFILRADTDDISAPDRAEKELTCLVNGKYDLLSSDVLMFFGDIGNQKGYRSLPSSESEIRSFAKKRCPFNHPSVAFRKSAVIAAGNYETLLYREDWYLWVRMLQNGCRCTNIAEPLVYMRTDDNQLRRRSNRTAYESIVKLFKYMKGTHFISGPRYAWNRFVFWGQRICPLSLERWIYKHFLHNGKR